MEKFSEEWSNNLKEKLADKFKYLFISNMHHFYDLLNIEISDVVFHSNKIEEMFIDITLDYNGSCDGDSNSIYRMLEKISTDVLDFFYKFQVDPETFKFSSTVKNIIVNEPFFWEINFKMDELHKVNIEIRIDYGVQ